MIAFFLPPNGRASASPAFRNQDLIYFLVAYAWTGLGSSFGPPLVLSLRWKRITWHGVLAGMLTGATSTILWKNIPGLNDFIDLQFSSFVISLIFTVVVSLLTADRSRGKTG